MQRKGVRVVATDTYKDIGYGDREIGFGRRPAVIVVDFQRAFTDPNMESIAAAAAVCISGRTWL